MGEVHRLPAREDAAGAPEKEGRVLTFPTADREGEALPAPEDEQPRSCLLCKHVAVGDSVSYCTMWREEIMFESVAALDCEAYEMDDDAALLWGD